MRDKLTLLNDKMNQLITFKNRTDHGLSVYVMLQLGIATYFLYSMNAVYGAISVLGIGAMVKCSGMLNKSRVVKLRNYFKKDMTEDDVQYVKYIMPYGYRWSDEGELLYQCQDFRLYDSEVILGDGEKCRGLWFKEEGKEAILVKIKGRDYTASTKYSQLKEIERINGLSDVKEWHAYVIKLLQESGALAMYLNPKSEEQIECVIREHRVFFERNVDRLRVFDYQYYVFNLMVGDKGNINFMMDKIDSTHAILSQNNTQKEMISASDLDVELLLNKMKSSQLDVQMKGIVGNVR